MASVQDPILDPLPESLLGPDFGAHHMDALVPAVQHHSMAAPTGNYLPVFLFGPQPSIWSQNHGGSSWGAAQVQPPAHVMPTMAAPTLEEVAVAAQYRMVPSPVDVCHPSAMGYPAMSLVIHPPSVPYMPPAQAPAPAPAPTQPMQPVQHLQQPLQQQMQQPMSQLQQPMVQQPMVQYPQHYERHPQVQLQVQQPVAPQVVPQMPPQQPLHHVHIQPQTTAEPPVLDYDLQAMTEFIATIVQEAVFVPGEQAAPHVTWDLRMFLNSMLLATRLQRSTVLLSLAYLFRRWRLAPQSLRTNHIAEMKEFIVVGFMLANKINDDNTFTNASWAEASGLPARQLMVMEAQWLAAIKWSLAIDPEEWDAWSQFCNFQQTSGAGGHVNNLINGAGLSSNYPSPCIGHAGYLQEHSVAAF